MLGITVFLTLFEGMTYMFEILTSLLSTLGFGGILLFFIKRYFDKRDKQELIKTSEQNEFLREIKVSLETIRLLAYARMSQEIEKLLEQGYATHSERKILDEMYRNYKEHGWNGDMDSRLEKVYSLPINAPSDDDE